LKAEFKDCFDIFQSLHTYFPTKQTALTNRPKKLLMSNKKIRNQPILEKDEGVVWGISVKVAKKGGTEARKAKISLEDKTRKWEISLSAVHFPKS